MAIRSVTRQEFDQFNPARGPMAASLVEEIEWFADDSNVVIGTVARDRTDKDWSIVVLGRDQRGRFHAIDLEVSIETQDKARTLLYTRVEKALATGDTVFPQED